MRAGPCEEVKKAERAAAIGVELSLRHGRGLQGLQAASSTRLQRGTHKRGGGLLALLAALQQVRAGAFREGGLSQCCCQGEARQGGAGEKAKSRAKAEAKAPAEHEAKAAAAALPVGRLVRAVLLLALPPCER